MVIPELSPAQFTRPLQRPWVAARAAAPREKSDLALPQPAAEMTLRRLPGHANSLGVACHFVARLEPFASFRSADLVRTLDAQIERQHYLFALEGKRVLGYCGWALYDKAVAERFARGGPPPPNALAQGSDVVWVLTAAALHPTALKAMARALRDQYPGRALMGIRHRSGARHVANVAARGQHLQRQDPR
jgi:hemolysin-activating ACP:hemolysin acyltransferase